MTALARRAAGIIGVAAALALPAVASGAVTPRPGTYVLRADGHRIGSFTVEANARHIAKRAAFRAGSRRLVVPRRIAIRNARFAYRGAVRHRAGTLSLHGRFTSATRVTGGGAYAVGGRRTPFGFSGSAPKAVTSPGDCAPTDDTCVPYDAYGRECPIVPTTGGGNAAPLPVRERPTAGTLALAAVAGVSVESGSENAVCGNELEDVTSDVAVLPAPVGEAIRGAGSGFELTAGRSITHDPRYARLRGVQPYDHLVMIGGDRGVPAVIAANMLDPSSQPDFSFAGVASATWYAAAQTYDAIEGGLSGRRAWRFAYEQSTWPGAVRDAATAFAYAFAARWDPRLASVSPAARHYMDEVSAGRIPPDTGTLRVTVMGSGMGTVAGAGISCSNGGAGTCLGSYPIGSTVRLTATPATGSKFDGWLVPDGPCAGAPPTCDVTISGDNGWFASFSPG